MRFPCVTHVHFFKSIIRSHCSTMVVNIKYSKNNSTKHVSVLNEQNARDNFELPAGTDHNGNLWIPYSRSGYVARVNIDGFEWRIYDENYIIKGKHPNGAIYDMLHVSGDTDVNMFIYEDGKVEFQKR